MEACSRMLITACWGFDEAREFLEAYCQLPEFDGQTKIKGGSENEKEK